jgi:hypothetical protein
LHDLKAGKELAKMAAQIRDAIDGSEASS